jgi:hypothetical protein
MYTRFCTWRHAGAQYCVTGGWWCILEVSHGIRKQRPFFCGSRLSWDSGFSFPTYTLHLIWFDVTYIAAMAAKTWFFIIKYLSVYQVWECVFHMYTMATESSIYFLLIKTELMKWPFPANTLQIIWLDVTNIVTVTKPRCCSYFTTPVIPLSWRITINNLQAAVEGQPITAHTLSPVKSLWVHWCIWEIMAGCVNKYL